jgi:DNA modification methylase
VEGLKVEQWSIDKLVPYCRNPRKNDAQVDRMCSAIREFGFRIPIVAKSDGSVVDGHLRLKAAQKLGLKEVPVALADELTDAQVKAFRILANKSANWAEWDTDLLKLEVQELEELDFDLELTGFELPELEDIMGAGVDGGTEGQTDPDAVPEAQEEPVSRLGDVWLLGRHRLMCGDSTDAGSVALLMAGEKADMVFTSPPYNAASVSIEKGRFGKEHKNIGLYGRKGEDAKPSDEYVDFAQKVLRNCIENTDGMIYWNVSYNANSRFEYIAQIVPFFDLLVDQVCWKKHLSLTNTSGGYTRIWEPIYVFSTREQPMRMQGTAFNHWEIDNVGAQVGDHRACFPVALPLKALDLYGDQIKTVLEPFCGAGSTLIACEQRGVACRGMELEPRFCDVIIRRWQEFTGQDATLEEDGRTFAQVKEERGA